MRAEEANRPRTAGGWGYEAWYVTVQQPELRRGFWLRYTTLRPSPGSSAEPHAAVWAFSFDRDHPERNTAAKRMVPLSDFEAGEGGVRVGDSVLRVDGCTGRIPGQAEWDLRWQTRAEPFAYLDQRFGFLSTVSNVASRPLLVVEGEIECGGHHHPIRALGAQQHTWGRSHALLQNWATAAGLGDSGWLAAATVRVRSRLGRTMGGTSLGLELAGRRVAHNAPWDVLRRPGRISPESWEARLRSGRTSVTARVTPRRQDLIGAVYTDPDGARRVCYHTEVADVEVVLSEGGVEVARAARAGACAFEYQSEGPLPGLPPRL